MYSYAAISRRIATRLRLNNSDVAAVVDALLRKHRRIRRTPGLAGLGAGTGWIVVYGLGGNYLEKTRFDIVGLLRSWGSLGAGVSLVMGYGLAIAIGTLVASWVSSRILLNAISRMPRDENGRLCVCEECLYPMVHAPEDEVSRCPECGGEYFRRGAASAG